MTSQSVNSQKGANEGMQNSNNSHFSKEIERQFLLGVLHVPRFRPGLNFTNPNLVVDKNRQQTGRPFKQLTTSSSQTSKRANMKKTMLKISTSKKKGFIFGGQWFFSQ